MQNIHICIVSEQTIPNILSIYHFKPDRLIFLTTERMEAEKRTDFILNALKIYGLDYTAIDKHERVKMNQDSFEECQSKIAEIVNKHKDDKMVVNITGGTKIMSLAAYECFRDRVGHIIYIPIPKNEFITIKPKDDKDGAITPLELRVSVEAYVTAYGVKVRNKNKLENLKNLAKNNESLSQWMVENYTEIENLLRKLYVDLCGHRDDKNFPYKLNYELRNAKEAEFLEKIEIRGETKIKTLLKEEIRFLTGDWLSTYCFNVISNLNVDDCATEIELESSKGVSNEFDVMFTKDNALYIIECKTLGTREEKYSDFLYKISALQQEFGLRVRGFLVSTSRDILDKNNQIKDNVIKRGKQCFTDIVHPNEIIDLGGFIKSKIRGL